MYVCEVAYIIVLSVGFEQALLETDNYMVEATLFLFVSVLKIEKTSVV